MQNFLRVLPQYLVPQHMLSRVYGWLAKVRHVDAKNWMIRTFIRRYQVDMSLALLEKPEDYPTFNDFFTRKLKAELRPIANNPGQIASPVDGVISQIGSIRQETLIQAKGFDFNLTQLLGGDKQAATLFQDGHFTTIYLSPKHYHRIHMPLAGTLKKTIFIPGSLFSVNQLTASSVPNLFARNERLVCIFDTAIGPMAVILVGAMIVGSIETVWNMTPKANKITSTESPNIELQTGAELGAFKLGSTVIVLFAKNKMDWSTALQTNSEVIMGEEIGKSA